MELYFYTNPNSVRDILSQNAIAASCTMEKNRAKSIGYISDIALFLTHKKLKSELRDIDLNAENAVHGITLRINILDELAKEITAILVKEENGRYVSDAGNLSDYVPQNGCVGCFIPKLIPFSFISAFIFENDVAMKDIRLPSEDLWYPEQLFESLDGKAGSFNEDLDLVQLHACASEKRSDDWILAAKNTVTEFNKKRAMAYSAITATEKWDCNKYLLNVDPYIQDMIEVTEDQVAEKVGIPYGEIMFPKDVLTASADDPWKLVHECILGQLLKDTPSTEYNAERFAAISTEILTVVQKDSFNESVRNVIEANLKKIQEIIYLASTKLVMSDLLVTLQDAQPLTALLMVMKQPHNLSLLQSILEMNHVNCVSSRLAQIYFAAINGMQNILATPVKKNLKILRKLEELYIANVNSIKVYTEEQYKTMLGAHANLLSAYNVTSELQISPTEIREYLLSPAGKSRIVLSDIFEKYGEVKGVSSKLKPDPVKYIGYYVYASFTGDKNAVNDLIRNLKNLLNNEESHYGLCFYKTEEFYNDYIVPEEKFLQLYRVKPDYWKGIYLAAIRK